MDQGLRSCATNMALFERAQALGTIPSALHYHPVAPQWAHGHAGGHRYCLAASGAARNTHLLETRLQREWADVHFPQGFAVAGCDRPAVSAPDGGACVVTAR
jgi:hypothetical protein